MPSESTRTGPRPSISVAPIVPPTFDSLAGIALPSPPPEALASEPELLDPPPPQPAITRAPSTANRPSAKVNFFWGIFTFVPPGVCQGYEYRAGRVQRGGLVITRSATPIRVAVAITGNC